MTDSEILKTLQVHGGLVIAKISELASIPELEVNSNLNRLIHQGYVFRADDKFSLTYLGKLRVKESKN